MHDKFKLPLVNEKEKHLLIVVSEDDKVRLVNMNRQSRVVAWNEEPPIHEMDKVEYIRIIDPLCKEVSLPKVMSHVNSISGLEIPSHLFISAINLIDMCNLSIIHITTEKHENFTGKFILDKISTLVVSGGGSILYDRYNFPGLTYISSKVDRKGKLLSYISQFKILHALEATPLNQAYDPLGKIRHLPLNYLRISGGNLETLQGVEGMVGITNLWLQDLSKLKNIKEIAQLENLTELTIGYCRHISDVDNLLTLKSLKKVQFFGCGDIGILPIKKALESKLEVLKLGGSS